MAKTKTAGSGKKNLKKARLKSSTKRKILTGGIIAAIVLIIGVAFAYAINVPAKVLPGAVIAGEKVSVAEVNYYMYQSLTYYSYFNQDANFTSIKDLDKIKDATTGQTYRQFFLNEAAETLQRQIVLGQDAKANGFVPQGVQRLIDTYVSQIRSSAKTNNLTADQVLERNYGRGMSVSIYKNILNRELTAQEYQAHLQQTKWNLTPEEMEAKYNEAPEDYEKATYNAFLFPADIAEGATEEEKATALEAATKLAQSVVDLAKSPESFRDAVKVTLGAAGESQFADGADPTKFEGYTKSNVEAFQSEEVATWLFARERKGGEATVITGEAGAYAVLFTSRDLDVEENVSYRQISLDFEVFKDEVTPTPVASESAQETSATGSSETTSADPAATTAAENTATPTPTATPSPTAVPMNEKTKAAMEDVQKKLEEYKGQVTDEASFTSLALLHSDNTSNSYTGGLVSGKTQASFTNATEEEALLSAWLFDSSRKPGDMIIISGAESVSLYYFRNSMPAWQASLLSTNITTGFNDWFDPLLEKPENSFTLLYDNLDFADY